MKTTVLPATGEEVARASSGCGVTYSSRSSKTFTLCASAKKSAIASATTSPMPSMRRARGRPRYPCLSGCQHGRAEILDRAVEAGEQTRRRLADVADAEREDEAVERDIAPRRDGVEQLGCRLRPPALALLEPSLSLPSRASSVKMSSGDWISLSSKKAWMCFSPSPSMSKALRETKCFRRSTALGRADEAAGAAAHHVDLAGFFVGLAHGVAAADRAAFGELEGFCLPRALLRARCRRSAG